MEAPLQAPGNQVDEVKVTVFGCPPGCRKVNAPAPFAGTEEVRIAAKKRRPFLDVERQGLGFEPGGCFSGCPQHPPPRNGAAVMAHDGTDLPRPPGTKKLGNVPIGQY